MFDEPMIGRVVAPNPDFTSPSLQVVAAYSPESFAQLLRTGVALGGRKLDTMSPLSRNNLSHFTDAEIAALFSYLHAMPEAAHNRGSAVVRHGNLARSCLYQARDASSNGWSTV